MFKNVCKMFQNVPECMQNVPECSRMYEKYPECSSMFQTVCRVCQNVPKCMQNACRSMSLPAVTYACLQVHELACSFFLSEQLTRISQCFFLQDQWEKLLAVSICCCMIYVCYKELAIAGCKWFWCYLMQLLDEVGFPTPISNEVCDGIMRPGHTCQYPGSGRGQESQHCHALCEQMEG